LNRPLIDQSDWVELRQCVLEQNRSKCVTTSWKRLAMRRLTTILTFAAGALVVAISSVYLSYSAEIGRSRARTESGGRTADTSVGRVEYAEKGVGVPLLSIHGAGGGYDQGLDNIADLVGEHFRIIAPSRFGYLGAPIPFDTSSAAQADAFAALLRTLKIEKTVVVGVSAGARSAVEFALRHPDSVSALILVVPGTYAPTSPVSIQAGRGNEFVFWLVNAGADFVWWAMEKCAPSQLVRFVGIPPQVFADSSATEQRRVVRIIANIEPLSRRFRGINIDSHQDDRRPPLEEITAPTLVISARDDLFNTLPAAEFAAKAIPNAELIVYPSGGHLLLGHGAEVRNVVSKFLAANGIVPVEPTTAASQP